MSRIFERSSTRITISEFYENYKAGKYNFNAAYQRKSNVWNEDKKSFLIDSILKNYPMPAIFLRPVVNNATGKTVYDIIDGKQRLESIIGFIENKTRLTSYFFEDVFWNTDSDSSAKLMASLSFEEIQRDPVLVRDFIRQFWTYTITVEYLYENNSELIASVFDRLNRNGEPLQPQELRNAKYANSLLLKTVRNLRTHVFWKNKLGRSNEVRMEDEEFISELLFLIFENSIQESSQKIIDKLYEKYADEKELIEKAKKKFILITDFLEKLNINYKQCSRILWTTHLYGLFSFGWYCVENNIKYESVERPLKNLYAEYFDNSINYEGILEKYKISASSRTRSQSQRKLRLEAIKEYCLPSKEN